MDEDQDTTDQQDRPDAQTAVASLTARYGDVQRAAERLWEINDRLTRKVNRLEQRPELPEGGRILTAEEAARYDAIIALGSADELRVAVEERETLRAEVERRDRMAAREKAARALGIEGSDLDAFAGADRLAYEVREVEEGGVKKHIAYVKDADGAEHTLADYGRQTWGRAFEAVLGAASQADNESTAPRTYPRQAPTGAPPKSSDPVEAHIRRMKQQAAARPNALLPQTQTT